MPALLARYTSTLPRTLARVQAGTTVVLKDLHRQQSLNKLAYDLVLKDGLVQPARDDTYLGPNGCSLREPLSQTFQEIARNFDSTNTRIYILEKGTALPKNTCVVHEHSDSFSLQSTEPVKLPAFNKLLTEWLNSQGRALSIDQFCDEFPFDPTYSP